MGMQDNRSYKVVVVPDYVVNPANYPHLPQHSVIYEAARDAGYGVMKLPPTDIPESQAEKWVEMTADMIEEYLKKGYVVAVIGVKALPDMGVWMSRLQKELEARKAPHPKVVRVSEEELRKGGETLSNKIKITF